MHLAVECLTETATKKDLSGGLYDVSRPNQRLLPTPGQRTIAYFRKFYASASAEAFLFRTAIACWSSSKSNGLDIIMSTLSSS